MSSATTTAAAAISAAATTRRLRGSVHGLPAWRSPSHAVRLSGSRHGPRPVAHWRTGALAREPSPAVARNPVVAGAAVDHSFAAHQRIRRPSQVCPCHRWERAGALRSDSGTSWPTNASPKRDVNAARRPSYTSVMLRAAHLSRHPHLLPTPGWRARARTRPQRRYPDGLRARPPRRSDRVGIPWSSSAQPRAPTQGGPPMDSWSPALQQWPPRADDQTGA